jgi:hypothetical protein
MKKCTICKGEIHPQKLNGKAVWTDGHNAEPVKTGRCCDDCNWQVVIPIRLNLHFKGEYHEATS